MIIDIDKAVTDYGIRSGRTLIGPNGLEAEIISVNPQKREIILKVGDKIYPPADLGKLAYNLLLGKGSVKGQ